MDTIKVTDFADFFKAKSGEETRYYATRDAAMAFDAGCVSVKGYGVYDTNVSGIYAVEVYPTKEQAKAHAPSPVKKAPTSALDDSTEDADNEAEDAKFEDGEKPSKTASKFGTKKRGR